MIVKTGKEEEEINKTVKARRIQRTNECKYLGITISTDGQLTEHIKELNSRCDFINREICAIRGKTQVEKEELRVKLRLFETCLMPAFLYGIEAWKKLSKAEIQHLEKVQGNSLKRIFSLPIITPYIGLIIETGVWPAEQRMNYSSLMLQLVYISQYKQQPGYIAQTNIIYTRTNSTQNHSNTCYDKGRTIAEELNIKLEKAAIMKKSDWKRTVKTKIKLRIKFKKEQKRKLRIKPNQLRTVAEEKWEKRIT